MLPNHADRLAIASGLPRHNHVLFTIFQPLLVFPTFQNLLRAVGEVGSLPVTTRLPLGRFRWDRSLLFWHNRHLSLFAWIWGTCHVGAILFLLSLMVRSCLIQKLSVVSAKPVQRARATLEGLPLIPVGSI